MKRLLFSAVVMAAMAAQAQDTYLNHTLTAGTDLFGTARYVGMGGATGVLGGDISGISSNPAGIGLFKHSDVSLTAGFVRQTDENINGKNPVHGSFDQIGGVCAFKLDNSGLTNFNFAINYQRKADFKHVYLADQPYTGGLSLSHQMAILLDSNPGYATPTQDGGWYMPSALSQALYDAGVIYLTKDGWTGQNTNVAGTYKGNQFQSVASGGVHAFDFNLSGNWEDRVFFGLTVGVDYLKYKNTCYYTEFSGEAKEPYDFDVDSWKKVTGTGWNAKLGFIVRPIEDASLRLGFTLETPTFYKLKMDADVDVTSHTDAGDPSLWYAERATYMQSSSLDYNLRSPWRIRAGVGYNTVGKCAVAVGAEYELSLHKRTKVSYGDDGYDDYDYYNSSESDEALNDFTAENMKNVHGIKLGAELKAGDGTSNFFFRLGYNYYTKAFDKDAYLPHNASFTSMDVATTAHYMNLGDVNIATVGLGYKYKNVYFDMTYKYRTQKGKFYAFDDIDLMPVNVNLDTHQMFFTLGYKF